MASILGNVDWQKQGSEAFTYLKGLGNKVKQMALQLTEIEIKVEDATNNEPWGPHGKDMAGEERRICLLENMSWTRFLHPMAGLQCRHEPLLDCTSNPKKFTEFLTAVAVGTFRC